MSWELLVSVAADKKFKKLAKKNHFLLAIIEKKVAQILENPQHYKPLRGDMHGARRVHVNSHFILTYEIDEEKRRVRLLDFDHHDKIY